jgi:hypothetical protein
MSDRGNPNSLERLAEDIDRVEADLIGMQSRLWSIRQRIQTRLGKKIGFQYDDESRRPRTDGDPT